MQKSLMSFLKPLQSRIDMIFLTLLMVSFLLLDINDDSNRRFCFRSMYGILRVWLLANSTLCDTMPLDGMRLADNR